MSVQDVAIEVSHLTAGYPGVRVLEDVSFSVKRGEIFALLGGSGCGKSTIMKHLIGLVPARGGTITVDGLTLDAANYMEELNTELWKLGILAKTEHNEVAPAQHELAPIYTTTNRATDQNQLTMAIMQRVAAKHGMVCLLHEKPFAGVYGVRGTFFQASPRLSFR